MTVIVATVYHSAGAQNWGETYLETGMETEESTFGLFQKSVTIPSKSPRSLFGVPRKRSTPFRPPSFALTPTDALMGGQAATYAGGVDGGQRQQQQRHTDDQEQLSCLEKALQQAHGGPVWMEPSTALSPAPHYAPLSVQEDVSHLSWLRRVGPLWSREQKSRVAVPSFHRKLGSLPSALGGVEQHSVMAMDKQPGKDCTPGRWVLSLWLPGGRPHSRCQQKPSQAMSLQLLVCLEELFKALKKERVA